jgi:hypothetical protein
MRKPKRTRLLVSSTLCVLRVPIFEERTAELKAMLAANNVVPVRDGDDKRKAQGRA